MQSGSNCSLTLAERLTHWSIAFKRRNEIRTDLNTKHDERGNVRERRSQTKLQRTINRRGPVVGDI
jgi:hypothetical protein